MVRELAHFKLKNLKTYFKSMRTVALWVGVLIIIVILFVGFLRWRQPQPARTPLVTTSVEEEAGVVSPLEQEVPSPSPTITVATVPSPAASPASAGASISITDTGFSPATLTVPANTTVTFTNNGQGSHRPASDPHPVHTGLVGFDAGRALSTGETYSFTFTQPGTWGFHDHPNPLRRGSIVVQ